MTVALQIPPIAPTGMVKTFGPFGPMYQVGKTLRPVDDDDWMVAIRIVETGEETEYRYSHMANDPEAR
ncbi:MAG: DUF5397 family protein [Capsulimonas sp.]|uniref:DUF5397 family protein n=1 Tax=Capsulimonas sp. TaxID=2494211 RepID=UPI0032673202